MKILYLHGLEGELSDEKRAVLTAYGEAISPKIDYRSDNQIIASLHQQYCNQNIDVVIGSSMGGFTGYYLSLLLDASCLAFNPALPYRSVEQLVPVISKPRTKYLQVVLGSKDQLILAADTIDFLSKSLSSEANARIHILNQLEHRIPLDVFIQEVAIFFHNLTLTARNSESRGSQISF